LVVSDFPSFRDPPKERNNYAYKKQNHLNEILNQFQAKESTEIPDDVMNEVICEIKKRRRIENIAVLTEQNIREDSQEAGRNRYYEHAAQIVALERQSSAHDYARDRGQDSGNVPGSTGAVSPRTVPTSAGTFCRIPALSTNSWSCWSWTSTRSTSRFSNPAIG